MGTLTHLLRRILQIPVVLVVTTLTIFIVVRATPGDPAELVLGMQTSPDALDALRTKFHLDKPLYQQYLIWLWDVVQGDLGNSIRLNRPVTQMLGERLWVSLQLAIAAMLFALIISIPLGILAAIWRNTWVDYFATGFTVLGFSIPNFASLFYNSHPSKCKIFVK